MICKNKRCRVVLGAHYWGDGYCSSDCMHHCMTYGDGERMSDRLSDPTDPTGQRAISETADETDAMLEAAEIDYRLPKIIYLRRRGKSWCEIGRACKCSHMTCYRIIHLVTPKLLRACGLQEKQ